MPPVRGQLITAPSNALLILQSSNVTHGGQARSTDSTFIPPPLMCSLYGRHWKA